LRFDGQDLELALYNEASRIDLNSATREELAALIELAQGEEGFDTLQRDTVADAILDWRDEDDLTMLNGAEDGDYEAAGYPYGARDDRFESVQELRQVLGMTQGLYRRLAPSLSVDNDTGRVDERYASASVLAATQGLGLEDAQRLVDERDEPVVPGAELGAPVDRGGPLYRVRVAQRSAQGPGRTMEALVAVREGGKPPFEVRWRRYGLLPDESPASGAEPAAQ
jgi:general secretion pathway protein K